MDNDTCDMVRDLLPLYVDGVCSDASRRLVDEHVAGCAACAGMLNKLRDSACEDSLRQEAAAVMAPRRWRNRAFATSCSLAAFLCVPACLAAVLGRGPGADFPLSWFYLLAPSLLVVMSATMLPLRSRRYTGRWTLLGYTASLLLLLLACCAYTAEGAPEVSGTTKLFGWTALALYVLSAVVIVPWALRKLPMQGALAKRRWLAALLWDGLFALLTAICAGLIAPGGMPLVLGILGLLAASAGTVYVLDRYLPIARTARLGLCVTFAGNALCWLAGAFMRLVGASESVAGWSRTITTVLLVLSTAAGLVLVADGVWKAYRRSVKKSG